MSDKTTETTSNPNDLLSLNELFDGGGEPWLPLLKPLIEKLPDADTFIGPKRPKTVVPVRELTCQALKPNPPDRWKVVIFGQNPYPRVESATGIAMFDNTFHKWSDSQFGRVMSIRCIIKAACIWKYGIDKKTPIADIRERLAEQNIVQPPEWFQAMLTQGVLLLNAALTASSDKSMSTEEHTSFWRPVVEKIIEEILKAKQTSTDDKHKGVVFAWWGSHARNLRQIVEKLRKKYPDVPIKHVDHCNPAAQGDIFCNGNHFAEVNKVLKSLGMDEVDWLPAVGWNKTAVHVEGTAERMGEFIARTIELHKVYLERLQSVKDEGLEQLPAIAGVLGSPLVPFADAIGPVVELIPELKYYLKEAKDFAKQKSSKDGSLTADEIAGLYLYTCESDFYRQLNATLRHPNRSKVMPYFGYLRLLFSALSKLNPHKSSLYRGVALDLRSQYPQDGTITWWGVSSCTSNLAVARGFLGSRGRRMLFEITPASAVSIRTYSAFTGEDEYILAPGTQLKVRDVQSEKSGLCTVKLEELAGQRLVS